MPKKVKRDWKSYNDQLVKRGELLMDLDFVENWERRWRVEGTFSNLKRTFGEFVAARKFENMIQESERNVYILSHYLDQHFADCDDLRQVSHQTLTSSFPLPEERMADNRDYYN